MKLVCIDNRNSSTVVDNDITIGKIYKIEMLMDRGYRIINDKGYHKSYLKQRFITVEEYRNKQLDKILA
jgi:hypothetical protein